jgi:membrane protein YqaA with SNARE-associated domain
MKSRPSDTLAQRRRRALGSATCSNTSRVVRGGLGALIGGVLGSMIGGGLAVAVATTQADITEPIASIARYKHWMIIGSGIAVLGAVSGLAIGAAKPEC